MSELPPEARPGELSVREKAIERDGAYITRMCTRPIKLGSRAASYEVTVPQRFQELEDGHDSLFPDDVVEYLESEPTEQDVRDFKQLVKRRIGLELPQIASFVGRLKIANVTRSHEMSRQRAINDPKTLAYADNTLDYSDPETYATHVAVVAADWMECLQEGLKAKDGKWPDNIASMRNFESDVYVYFATKDRYPGFKQLPFDLESERASRKGFKE